MALNMMNGSEYAYQLEMLRLRIQQCHSENVTHSTALPPPSHLAPHAAIVGLFCSKIFDGLLCWDATPAGAYAVQKCPGSVYGWSPDREAYKKCSEDGHWAVHPETRKHWTNYTTCVDTDDMSFREVVILISTIGYAISLTLLCISIAIFIYFNLLQSTRTKLHAHMFAALACNCVSWLLWYTLIVKDASLLVDNPVWCRLLTLANTYFMSASYMWMFCEGLHLHVCLVLVFVNKLYAMRTFLFIGWSIPLLMVIVYGSTRMFLGEVERCMIDESNAFYVLSVPVAISIALSIYFLIRVLMVLVSKASMPPVSGAICPTAGANRLDISKIVRAGLLLVALFGVYFIFMPVHPPLGSALEMIYAVTAALFTSLQGALVSVLFCFSSQEVTHLVKQEVQRRCRRLQEAIPTTGATAGESVVHVEEHAV